MSEQQFAASLDVSMGEEKPQFVIDDVVQAAAGESQPVSAVPIKTSEEQSADSTGQSQACEAPTAFAGSVLAEATSPAAGGSEADWRDQVSAKVNNYKARKPRQERYPSLRLQFDAPAPRMIREAEPYISKESAPQEILEQAAPPPIAMSFADAPLPALRPRILLEATARVLEFPRPASRADELADPVIDRPRIVEAPELLPPPPAMGGILMEPQPVPEPERRPGFEIPLRSASLRRRAVAGAFDAALVILAIALFGYLVVRINGPMPPLRSVAFFALGLLGALWPAYQYAFLVFSGKTPGLWLTRLQVSRFDGQPVSRRLRRWRVLASTLSFASLGLGYAWCFLDEDQLTWHDRITRTHLGP